MTQALESPTLSTEARRDRQLHRLIDQRAAAEAAAALRAAASAGNDVLTLADAVMGGADGAARDRLRDAAVSPQFLSLLPAWIRELREVASFWPDSGACTVGTALKLWSWTVKHFQAAAVPQAIDELAEAIVPLLAARSFALDVTTNASSDASPEVELRRDLANVYAAHASALAGAACAELVFGYRRHLLWDAEGCATCYVADDLDELEAVMPGIASGAHTSIDIIEADGSHPAKRGPCVSFNGLDTFMRLRNRLDGCLTGARIAKDRAAAAMARRG